jgi:hypothetical protein
MAGDFVGKFLSSIDLRYRPNSMEEVSGGTLDNNLQKGMPIEEGSYLRKKSRTCLHTSVSSQRNQFSEPVGVSAVEFLQRLTRSYIRCTLSGLGQ